MTSYNRNTTLKRRGMSHKEARKSITLKRFREKRERERGKCFCIDEDSTQL